MFKKAQPVYPKPYIDSLNITVLFAIDFIKKDNVNLSITGESEYQVYLNGNLIHYGPAKAAHNYHRVDNIKLTNLKDNNRLVILLASYRTNTFDRVNQSPFIQYELVSNNEIIDYSSIESVCYLYEPRIQKVTRFSYQRAFSESYNNKINNDIFYFSNEIKFKKLELSINKYGTLLNRNVHYPKLDKVDFDLSEKDELFIDPSKKIYEDRYMFNKGLVIFDKEDWEVDPNKLVSQFNYKKISSIDSLLEENQSLAFSHKVSLTGFVDINVEVLEDCEIYIYFDEMKKDGDIIDFDFYRNTTHNIISYQLKKGIYQLTGFAPYTAKYIRVSNLKGKVRVNELSLILLENPDSHNLKYNFENEKLQNIFEAARNTFASNAVDILTDCPSRERAGWLCDSYFSGRSERLFTGLNIVETNFLENYSLYQYHGDVPKDMIPMCYPADFFNNEMFIPNWAMFYVIELESYFSRENNEQLKANSMKNIKDLLRYFEKYENEYGFLENLEGWIMVEWSHANDDESIKGVNIPSNALYSAFLLSAGHILGDTNLIKKSEKINNLIKKLAYDGEFFVDNLIRDNNGKLIRNNRIGETTFYYLFNFDVISKDEYPKLFEIMVNDFGPNRDLNKVYPHIYKSNVFIGDYLRLEILLKNHLYDKVLEETVDYFYQMAVSTGTLWEHDSTFASLNHGFASYAANIIFEALTGIYKIDYLNKKIYVRKAINDERFSFKVPLGDSTYLIVEKGEDLLIRIDGNGYQIINN